MLFRFLTAVAVLFTCAPALAQHGVGNGGIGLVCSKNGKDTGEVVLADVLYGEFAWSLHPDLGPWDLPWQIKLDMALDRIPHQDVARQARYRAAARTFMRHAEYLATCHISRTVDYLNQVPFMRALLIERGCTTVQLANLRRGSKGDFSLRIDADAFQRLSEDQRALLILHEIVYQDWLQTVDGSIEPVYLLVALLASDSVAQMRPEDYRDLLRGNGWTVRWRE